MKKILSAIAISISTIIAASSAFAAPEHMDNHQQSAQKNQNQAHQNQQHMPSHGNAQKTQAKQNWKVGNQYPNQYRSSGYKVDYRQHKKLAKPAHNQQWYKVNNHYILENTVNHAILKIIAG